MSDIKQAITERCRCLTDLITNKKAALDKAPCGSLRCSCEAGRTQYYHRKNKKDPAGRYLKTSEKELVRRLAQKDYDSRVLKAAEKELDYLKKVELKYPAVSAEDVFTSMNQTRRALIDPIILPDDVFKEKWQSMDYRRKPFADGFPEYYTDKGERVRSKSEILIANLLKRMDIAYHYEKPLTLRRAGVYHPDFTVLRMRDRRTIYIEHLGMMDDPLYAADAVERMENYARNGIYPGENLIVTAETRQHPLNMKLLEAVLSHYLL